MSKIVTKTPELSEHAEIKWVPREIERLAGHPWIYRQLKTLSDEIVI